jgi:hypothetical protein
MRQSDSEHSQRQGQLIVFEGIGRISGIELADGRPRLKKSRRTVYIMHGITVVIAIMRLGAVLSNMNDQEWPS